MQIVYCLVASQTHRFANVCPPMLSPLSLRDCVMFSADVTRSVYRPSTSHCHNKMANNSPKSARLCPWDSSSPLAAKRRRLDSAIVDGNGPQLGVEDAAFDGCLRMSPTPDLDVVDTRFSQKLSAELKPPPSLLELDHPFALPVESDPSFPTVQLTPTSYVNGPANVGVDLCGPSPHPPAHVVSAASNPSMGMQASLAALEADSHAARLAHAKREQSDKSTAGTYKRHVDRYEKWWIRYQAEQTASIEGWTAIPAFPITPAKVSMFLGHESTREKVCIPLTHISINSRS